MNQRVKRDAVRYQYHQSHRRYKNTEFFVNVLFRKYQMLEQAIESESHNVALNGHCQNYPPS